MMMIMTTAAALALFLQQAARAEAQTMTTGGWVFMASAWFCILVLIIYTFSKVIRGGR